MLIVPLILAGESGAKAIGCVVVRNDGTGDAERGNYIADVVHGGKFWGRHAAWKTGKVSGHARGGDVYALVEKAIRQAAPVARGNYSKGQYEAIELLCEAAANTIADGLEIVRRSAMRDGRQDST